MTVRAFLLKEMEKRSVKVSAEISYTTPIGRLVPDMLLRNGAQYVVETKLGAETKLLDAIVRLYDYSKYTEAKGAFAVLFPEELRRPWTAEMQEKTDFAQCLEIEKEATKHEISKPTFYRRLAELAKEGILEKMISHRDIRHRVNYERLPRGQKHVLLLKPKH